MKAYLASILFLATATTFACDDDDDALTTGGAGTSSVSGSSGASGSGNNGGAGVDGGTASLAGNPALGGEGGNPEQVGGMPSHGGAPSTDGGAGLGGVGLGGEPGSDGAGGEASQAPLEIIGTWSNNFGGTEEISATHWGSASIAAYDNAANAVYTQLPADDLYNPSKFTKIVYTEPANDSFYYCWVVFSASTLSEAQTTTLTADASDPDQGGCGGFPWTKATKSP